MVKIKKMCEKVSFLGDDLWIVTLLAREDLADYLPEWRSVSDEEMEEIAREVAASLVPCFWAVLETVCERRKQ